MFLLRFSKELQKGLDSPIARSYSYDTATKESAVTEKQYQALLNLYHDYQDAFLVLPLEIRSKFYDRLYSRS